MTGPDASQLWTRLSRLWLDSGAKAPRDPRLAAEAGMPAERRQAPLSPLVRPRLR